MQKIFIAIFTLASLCVSAQVVSENFDANDGGWMSSSAGGGTLWAWGTPAGAGISDDNTGGGSAWVTDLNGSFNLLTSPELIYVTSPQYDLSSLSTEGSISVAINLDLAGGDWAYLEYSTDNGATWGKLGTSGTGTNWYDDSFDQVWTGNTNSLGAWFVATHDLPMDALGTSVRFRFVLDTVEPPGTYGAEGLGIDDFAVLSTNTGGGGGGGGAPLSDESFDLDDGMWVSSSDLSNMYWEWGAPMGAVIDADNTGGGSAWVTGLSGDFNVEFGDIAYLTSQPYDLSSLTTEGAVTLAINYDLGTFNNGGGDEDDFVVLQYSLDGTSWSSLGASGSGINWYNDATLEGWTLNSGGWSMAAHDLPPAALGESAVSFRFVFNSGAPTGLYGSEGFGFDDFSIVATSTGGGGSGGPGGPGGPTPGTTQILTMELSGELFRAVVDSTSSSVKLFVSPTTDVTALAPTFTLSTGATPDLASGSTQDFTNPVTYTITSSDGMDMTAWTVSAVVPDIRLSMYPQAGIPGTSVSIYGRGFSTTAADNTLTFGGVSVPVTNATANKLTFVVPNDAAVGSNAVSISANGLNSISGTTFNVLAANVTSGFADYTEADFNLGASSFVRSMAVGDVDGDGDVDLAFDNETILNISTLENGRIVSTVNKISTRSSGNSSFDDITLVDVDQDGDLDVVAGGARLGWFKNNGDGTWADETVIDQTSSDYTIRVFDIDGDFDLDVIAYDDFEVSSYTNDGNGSFGKNNKTAPSRLGPLVDWDEDGDMDILVIGSGQNIAIARNDGTGNFAEETLVTRTTADLNDIQFGDMDNDSDLDFVIGTKNFGTSVSTVAYILNNGDGTFATEVAFVTEGVFDTKRLELADLNNDGFLDVARTRSDGTNSSHVYFSTGSLTYGISEVFDSSAGTLDLVLVDIESDGDMDVLHEASASGGYFPLFINLIQDAEVTSFSFAEETGSATFNTTSRTIEVEVDAGADVTALTPTIAISTNATVSPANGVAQDFSSPVTYTVTAEDGTTTNDWVVTVQQVPTVPTVSARNVEQTSAVIEWGETNAAAQYELEISTAEDFSELIAGYDPFSVGSGSTTTISIIVSNLTIGTNYYVRARAQNAINTYSAYSSTVTFTTKPNDPVLTAVQTSKIGQDTISISWDAVSGVVDSYNVEVSLDENFATLLSDYPVSVTNPQVVLGQDAGTSALSTNTTYWIRVEAVNATGTSNYSNEVSALTKPGTPTVNAVDLSLIQQTEATVSWSSVFSSGGSYNVEVSSTDFSTGGTLLTGYPISVSGTSTVVGSDVNTQALTPATNYWVRVRASNGSGESPNSNVVSFLTDPSAPNALPASDILNESFVANWEAVTGADQYTLDVADDENFTTIFETISTASTSATVMNLAAATEYHYRVTASNASGTSNPSNTILVTTNRPPTNLGLDNSQFDENQAIGALVGTLTVDDPDDATHTFTLVSGTGDTNNDLFAIDGANLVTNAVFNFEDNLTYSVRVQATDPKGSSTQPLSFPITVNDLNDAPSDISLFTTGFTPTGFDEVPTEVGIFSTDDQDVGDTDSNIMLELTSGSDSFRIIKNSNGDSTLLVTDIVFTNEEDLIVPISVRATDDQGATVDANFDVTIAAFVDTEAPVITPSPQNASTFLSGGPERTLSVTVEDFRLSGVKFFSRLLTEPEFVSEDLTEVDGSYSKTVVEADLGVAGFEYYFEATDEASNVAFSTLTTLPLAFPESGENAPRVESVTKFGRTVDSYQIISIPFAFTDPSAKRVDAIFNEYNGEQINREYRIIKWDPTSGENGELVNLDQASTIELGEGYFFISAVERSITIESANINLTDPFPLELKQGWNLVGNPYNINIDWNSVLTNNGAAGIVGQLRVLDPENPERWPESNILKTLEGAFVFANQDITLSMSYTDASISFGGRVGDGLAEAEWFLPITLEQNGDFRKGGIGMDRRAELSLDAYDEPVLPKWLEYLEIAFLHEGERFSKYNKDVVPLTDYRIWEFEVSSSSAGTSTLKWDEESAQVTNLQLYHVESGVIVDMTEQSSFQFELNGTTKFQILFSTDPNETFNFEELGTLEAYPNPFVDSFRVPFRLPDTGSAYEIQVELLDLSGKVLHKGQTEKAYGGVFEYTMKKPKDLETGLYLYRVDIKNEEISSNYTKRIKIQ